MTFRAFGLLILTLSATAPAVAAAQADPAISTVETLDTALLEAMKSGKSAGTEGRYHKLAPVVDRVFDLPAMTRFAVGTTWSTYSSADQASLVKAFGRLTAANLAHNFSGFTGEQFKVNPAVQTRGPDKLVRTQIVPKSGDPTDLNYRMRSSGGAWKIIDVYYGAISQLTSQRSDFAATVNSGGANALIKSIDAQADKLLKS